MGNAGTCIEREAGCERADFAVAVMSNGGLEGFGVGKAEVLGYVW